MPLSTKRLFLLVTMLIGVIFLGLIVTLLRHGSVTFTEEDVITQPTILKSDPLLGSQNPKVVIVYFGNYRCEACADITASLSTLVERYPEDMTVVWKDFPNTSLEPLSYDAAIAARCADRQDNFWTYHTMLMANQSNLNTETFTTIAKELSLSEGAFSRCLKNQSPKNLVDEGIEEANDLSLAAAPVLFINGVRYAGAMDETALTVIVRSLIEQPL